MVLICASFLHLAAILQIVFELEGGIEVVLDRTLVAAGDQDDLLQPRGDRLLHYVLDGGLGAQEPRAEPGGGKDGLAHFHRDTRGGVFRLLIAQKSGL